MAGVVKKWARRLGWVPIFSGSDERFSEYPRRGRGLFPTPWIVQQILSCDFATSRVQGELVENLIAFALSFRDVPPRGGHRSLSRRRRCRFTSRLATPRRILMLDQGPQFLLRYKKLQVWIRVLWFRSHFRSH